MCCGQHMLWVCNVGITTICCGQHVLWVYTVPVDITIICCGNTCCGYHGGYMVWKSQPHAVINIWCGYIMWAYHMLWTTCAVGIYCGHHDYMLWKHVLWSCDVEITTMCCGQHVVWVYNVDITTTCCEQHILWVYTVDIMTICCGNICCGYMMWVTWLAVHSTYVSMLSTAHHPQRSPSRGLPPG